MKPDIIFPSRGVCDFCSSPNPTVTYVSEAFVAFALEHPEDNTRIDVASDDQWGACTACAKFVDAGDYQGLITRVLPMMPVRQAIAKQQLAEFDHHMRTVLTEVYNKFQSHKKLPA